MLAASGAIRRIFVTPFGKIIKGFGGFPVIYGLINQRQIFGDSLAILPADLKFREWRTNGARWTGLNVRIGESCVDGVREALECHQRRAIRISSRAITSNVSFRLCQRSTARIWSPSLYGSVQTPFSEPEARSKPLRIGDAALSHVNGVLIWLSASF